MAIKELDDKNWGVIEVGDIVYEKKSGWSGVPMEVLELNIVDTPHGFISQALCIGAKGWGLNGLYSEKYDARVKRLAVANLTHRLNWTLN